MYVGCDIFPISYDIRHSKQLQSDYMFINIITINKFSFVQSPPPATISKRTLFLECLEVFIVLSSGIDTQYNETIIDVQSNNSDRLEPKYVERNLY